MANSTGNQMKDMVRKGPSTYDCIFAYENVAIDYLKNAEGRWDALRVVYPHHNMWNDNPYYILDVPWSGKDQRKAAEAFLAYLMSDSVQKEALAHGFRPGNTAIPIRDVADSPFVLYEKNGLKIDPNLICAPPEEKVLSNLLNQWERRPK
jgi:ABC-type sulfate transport system substrate-binding protein